MGWRDFWAPRNVVVRRGPYLAGPPLTQPFDASLLGDNTIIPASPAYRLWVLSYHLVADDFVKAQWKSGLDWKISGLLSLAPNESLPIPPGPTGYLFQTEVGQALILNLSAAVHVGGSLVYQLYHEG